MEKLFQLINHMTFKRGILLNYAVFAPNFNEHKKSNSDLLKDSALVIQGPIMYPDFLEFVVEFYRINYPSIEIILSTWNDEKNIKRFYLSDKIHLIESRKPESTGISNINYQVISTLAGLNYATAIEKNYVLKIRTDQALFASNFIEQFRWALMNAPNSGYERIATTDFNSFLFRPNSPNDQIQFGRTSTLLKFWSSTLESSADTGTFPEEILLLSYLKSLGRFPPSNLKESLEVYRDLFVFVDSGDVGFFWRKGSWRYPDSRFDQLQIYPEMKFVTPSQWSLLQFDLESVLNEFKRQKRGVESN